MKHQTGGTRTYQCMWCRPKYFKKYRKKLGSSENVA